jgi:prolipoprotein diacylglyceryl transferase
VLVLSQLPEALPWAMANAMPDAGIVLASIPSPSRSTLQIGPLRANAYGLCLAAGMMAAVWLCRRLWSQRGGNPDDVSAVAMWGIPGGIIGARIYHVITDWKSFRGQWGEVFLLWKGGLGIWGGVALGVLAGMYGAKRRGLHVAALVDAAAPSIALGQAIGRWGNWFNQELFGRPTDLPWALEIAERKRPSAYRSDPTFHPTFLYESVWNLIVMTVVLTVGQRWGHRFRPGRLLAVYVAMYTTGRFLIETVRIDTASKVGGIRINLLVAAVLFVAAIAVIAGELRRPPRLVDPGSDPTDDQIEDEIEDAIADQTTDQPADQMVANPAQ